MTTGQAAAVLHCSRRTVLRLCEAGVIRANRSGGRWLLRPEALNAYLGCAVPSNDNAAANDTA